MRQVLLGCLQACAAVFVNSGIQRSDSSADCSTAVPYWGPSDAIRPRH